MSVIAEVRRSFRIVHVNHADGDEVCTDVLKLEYILDHLLMHAPERGQPIQNFDVLPYHLS
jgi:hypothetical protein